MRINFLDPFKEGYKAFEEGRPTTENPYTFTPQQENWLRGWYQAQDYAGWQARQSDGVP